MKKMSGWGRENSLKKKKKKRKEIKAQRIYVGWLDFMTYQPLYVIQCQIPYIYVVHAISFQTFFVPAFKIIVDSWKFSMLLLYILWDDWPIFMISGLNEQLQQQLEHTLLNPDCHSWWISKMQSGL